MIHIATNPNREVSRQCLQWANERFELTSIEECDIFVSVLYDKIIKPEFIESKKACLNFHPGILPAYRGCGICSWVIINGETEAGITLHEIDKGIDTGPIIDIARFPVEPQDTSEDVFRKGDETILQMFQKWMPLIATCQFESKPQTEKGRLYLKKDLDVVKDLTPIIRALTFGDKEASYYYDREGRRIDIRW